MWLLRPPPPLVAISSAVEALCGVALAATLAKVNAAINVERGLTDDSPGIFPELGVLSIAEA
jgi:hypothetical protein